MAVTNWKSITRNRTLADFKDGKISDEIAEMRLQYYEEKRRAHTKQVEETIRSGIIEDVKQEFPQSKQPMGMNRTARSTGRTQIFGQPNGGSPRMASKSPEG